MKTTDPFLRHLFGAVDRLAVWSILSLMFTALTWAAAWQRGLERPALDAWRALLALATAPAADRTAITLLALSAATGISTATLVGGWLFRRWQRRAQLDMVRIRGSRWEHEQ
jgi:hypothetical protein